MGVVGSAVNGPAGGRCGEGEIGVGGGVERGALGARVCGEV